MLDHASTLGSISTSATLKTPGNAATTKTQTGYRVSTFRKGHISASGTAELSAAAHALNLRPRETLGWCTPAEAFKGLLKSDMD